MASRLMVARQTKTEGSVKSGEVKGRQEAVVLDDSIFGQITELHVAVGLPWADHCYVCAKTLHARDVITKSFLARLGGLALECTGLPLLELGGSLLGGGGASCSSGRCQGTSCRGSCVHFC